MKKPGNLLGSRLRELRGSKTQHDIAQFLGITETAYGHYERGDRYPDLNSIKQLANYFHTSTDYLLGNTDNAAERKNCEAGYSPEEENIINSYRSLSEKNKGKVELFLEQLLAQQKL